MAELSVLALARAAPPDDHLQRRRRGRQARALLTAAALGLLVVGIIFLIRSTLIVASGQPGLRYDLWPGLIGGFGLCLLGQSLLR